MSEVKVFMDFVEKHFIKIAIVLVVLCVLVTANIFYTVGQVFTEMQKTENKESK